MSKTLHPAHAARLEKKNREAIKRTARVAELVRTGVDSDNPAFQKAWASLSEADRQVLLNVSKTY